MDPKECIVHAMQCAVLRLAYMIIHIIVYLSLDQVLIRQRWEASLPDVGWNKFVRVASAPRSIPKVNNT